MYTVEKCASGYLVLHPTAAPVAFYQGEEDAILDARLKNISIHVYG